MGLVPYVSLSHTWDQSHRCLTSIYGTGPIGISQPAMGPHAKIFMMESHTYLRTIYGTGPIDISKIHMGLVPYVSERYTWDWSHRWFSDCYGTSLWKSKHEVPCLAVRYLWDQSQYIDLRHLWDFMIESCSWSFSNSHSLIKIYHGTGPICAWEASMGPVPWVPQNHTRDYLIENCRWSFLNFFILKSHILYGTGPIQAWEIGMGLVP